MPQTHFPILLRMALLAGLAATPAWAATWSTDATVSDEKKTELTGKDGGLETNHTETFKQAYSIKYEIDVNPASKLSLDFALDITDEMKQPGYDTREMKPSLDAKLTAVWWDLAVTTDRSIKSSTDPAQETTEDQNWNVDFTLQPKTPVAPDLKVSYKKVRNELGGVTQKVDDSLEGSLDYTTFWDFLKMTANAKRSFTDDKIQEDKDKEDRDFKFDASFDHTLTQSLKIDGKWSNERSQSFTVLDAGDKITDTDTLKNTVEGKGELKPLDGLDLSLSKKREWNKDIVKDTLEVTDTWTGKSSYDPKITEAVDVSLSYNPERIKKRGTSADSTAYTRDYSASLGFDPFKALSLTTSFDRSDKSEYFKGGEKDSTSKVDDKWEAKAETSVWDDNAKFSTTRSRNISREEGRRTSDQSKWDANLDLVFDSVPNLNLTPKYTFTQDNDLLKHTTNEDRKVDMGIKYEVKLGSVTTLSLNHTYTRSGKKPAEGLPTIQRDDTTDFEISWKDFLKGMNADFKVNRKASDTSKDDKKAVIDYAYSFDYDWKLLEQYTISFQYKYDKKMEAEDQRSFLTTFSADFLKGLLTVDFEHEFTEQLEGDTKDTHRYRIEVKGTF